MYKGPLLTDSEVREHRERLREVEASRKIDCRSSVPVIKMTLDDFKK